MKNSKNRKRGKIVRRKEAFKEVELRRKEKKKNTESWKYFLSRISRCFVLFERRNGKQNFILRASEIDIDRVE